MATTTDTTKSAQPERPGLHDGVAGEFLVMAKIKPGQADALRKTLAGIRNDFMTGTAGREALKDIGTLHDARHVIFDNDTRFLFASVFDGSWDTYIDDFATTKIAENFELVFSHIGRVPGHRRPQRAAQGVVRRPPGARPGLRQFLPRAHHETDLEGPARQRGVPGGAR